MSDDLGWVGEEAIQADLSAGLYAKPRATFSLFVELAVDQARWMSGLLQERGMDRTPLEVLEVEGRLYGLSPAQEAALDELRAPA